MTRTPDAHWMAGGPLPGPEGRGGLPDYADNTKFADQWLHPHPGTDGALALAMGHVVLKEFFVDRGTFFDDYVRCFIDLPFLVTLTERDGAYVPAGKFLRAADLGQEGEDAVGRRSCWTRRRAARSSRTARWASAGTRRTRGSGTSTSVTYGPG
ncbi:molybdopterin-dependent oxidoreductase [Streptomyces thinghirensis]|nr:molybdopterin-dependent oxidoreductase [Streptomyces thinghirensis]